MNDIKVSVLCLAYNHEKFIRECLESILEQKTDFSFEVIIHDDHSTDNTATIIREYAKYYPDKIVPIYQNMNLYSKGVAIAEEQMLSRARGKYVAFCECDDKWVDDRKLQKQYEYMERHADCSMCTHNTIVHDVNDVKRDTLFNNWEKEHLLNEKEVFLAWKVHTSSYFVRKEDAYRPIDFRKYWFGDYVRLTVAYTKGNIVNLPYIMSQYNYGVKSGALNLVDHSKINERKKRVLDREYYLEELNNVSNGKYDKVISRRILMTKLEADTLQERDILAYSSNQQEIIEAVRTITRKSSFKKYWENLNHIEKAKEWIRYKGYIVYPLWIKLWKK